MVDGFASGEEGERHLMHMSGFSTIESPEGEEERVYYFGEDKKGWNLRTELRGTLINQIRGEEPTTILGILIKQSQLAEEESERLVAMETLAEMAGRTLAATEAIVDYLATEDLAVTVTDEGVEKAVAFAFYTPKNETMLPAANEDVALRALSR